MKRKAAPSQYTQQPKEVVAPVVKKSHPSEALAHGLVRWIDTHSLPPSTVLMQGLGLARSAKHDGLPIDQVRPHFKPEEGDNRLVMKVLEDMKVVGVNRVALIAELLKKVWVNKAPSVKAKPIAEKPKTNKSKLVKKVVKVETKVAPVVTIKKQRKV